MPMRKLGITTHPVSADTVNAGFVESLAIISSESVGGRPFDRTRAAAATAVVAEAVPSPPVLAAAGSADSGPADGPHPSTKQPTIENQRIGFMRAALPPTPTPSNESTHRIPLESRAMMGRHWS